MSRSRNQNQTSPLGSPTSGNIISDSSSKEQDRFLPIANVSRIMKRALPANAKISKEAKEIVQECVSEFISFVTGEASDKCQREKRKTINGDDLLWAMTTLGFDNYVGPLKAYFNNYKETDGEKGAVTVQDHSPTEPNDGVAEINKLANSLSTEADFPSFINGGFYSVGSHVTPKSSAEMGGLTGYRESSMNMGIAQNVVSGDGYADGNMMMAAANLRYGVEW